MFFLLTKVYVSIEMVYAPPMNLMMGVWTSPSSLLGNGPDKQGQSLVDVAMVTTTPSHTHTPLPTPLTLSFSLPSSVLIPAQLSWYSDPFPCHPSFIYLCQHYLSIPLCRAAALHLDFKLHPRAK